MRAGYRSSSNAPVPPFRFPRTPGQPAVVGFGFGYDYDQRRVIEAPPIPDFPLPLRAKVAEFAPLSANAFTQVLLYAYRPGAGIGWHRDKPHFANIASVSLLAACDFRLRRKKDTPVRRGRNGSAAFRRSASVVIPLLSAR